MINSARAVLVANYTFQEGTGSTVNDYSGNDYDGVLSNSSAWTTTSVNDYAIDFDGVDDLVNLSTPSDVAPSYFNFGDSDWAVSMWIKTTQTSSEGVLWNNGQSADLPGISFTVNSGNLAARVRSGGVTYDFTGGYVADGKWHYVVLTRDSGNIYIFTDGVYGTNATGVTGSADSDYPTYIGGRSSGTPKYFDGIIDEVLIYDNESITQAQAEATTKSVLPVVTAVWDSPDPLIKGDVVTITGSIDGKEHPTNMTVCSTNSFTDGACDGVTLCSNSSTVINGNLTCDYVTTSEGVKDYYVFATNEFGDSSGVSGSFTVEPGVFDIQITSPENTTYYTTSTFLNYTVKSYYDAVPCWVQNNTGAFEYLGNITNNTLVSIPFNISHGLTEGKKWVNITCMDEAYDYNYTQDKYYTVSSFNFINNTFTSPIPDGSFNSHVSNIKYNQDLVSNITATLNYNSTNEPSTYSDSNTNNGVIRTFNSSFYIPEVYDELVNSSIYWNYTLYYLNGSTGYYTTPLQNQTIQMIAIDDCTTYTNKVLNFTGADELSLTYFNFSIDATINISKNNLVKTFNFSFTNDSYYHELCAIPVDAGFDLYSTFNFYDGDNGVYAKRGYYIVDYPLISGNPSLVDLYLISKSVASPVKVIVQDASGINQEGLYVKLQRYYPENNLFRTVQVGKTDSNGEVNFYVEPSDLGGYAEYYLIIENETTELKRFGPRTFLSTDTEVTVKLVESTLFSFTEMQENINVGVTFNNITNVTSISFSSTSNTANTYGYSIILTNVTSNYAVCSNSTTSTSVTFTCYLGNVSNNFYLVQPWAVDSNGNKYYFTQFTINGEATYKPGFIGVLISIMLFLVVTGAFLVLESPHISLLSGAISVIIIATFNLIPAKEVLLSLFSIYIIGLYLINIGR